MEGRPVDLTAREREVFKLIAEGLTPAEVASHLFLTAATVNGHMLSVRRKLGASSTAHAVLIAERCYRHLLRGAVARHGTRAGWMSHHRNGTEVCPPCEAVGGVWSATDLARMNAPERPTKSTRLRPTDPVECGSMSAVGRHVRQGEKISELTCACRETNREYYRRYRATGSGVAA